MREIKTVGICGAGTMGSALAQKFATEGFKVILLDTQLSYVAKGLERIKTTLEEGIARKIFNEEQVSDIMTSIQGTDDIERMIECDLIIEAIFENFEAKKELFRKLDLTVPKETILATNTSSFSVSELAECISYPGRFIGLHYFYHAAKNRLVEIIPGAKTSEDTFKAVQIFSVQSGKDAITCKDSFGFVVNRFFVPWLNEAVRLYEEEIASPGEIDAVCMKIFSISMGPFALMNATGVPVAYHAEKTLEHFGNMYNVADALRTQAEKNEIWQIQEADLDAIAPDVQETISKRMQGIVFFVCSQLLDEKVCTATEINRGARIGLRWRKGPIDLMKKSGKNEVNKLITNICNRYSEKSPFSIGDEFWKIEMVTYSVTNDNAVITINRPEDMNALNENVVKQIENNFDKAESDPHINNIFITGSGKAFVAGADIKFFIDNIRANTIDNIVSFTKYCQDVFEKIDKSRKKVVAVLNGLALGGGLELALCADVILAAPKAVMAFPETGIGIYPGLGGTQRTQKRIGKEHTKYLIFTGDFISANDALKTGLVDKVLPLKDLTEIMIGNEEIPQADKTPPDEKFTAIGKFFSKYSCGNTLASDDELSAKLLKRISQKAPLAIRTAEKLIDEAAGCESELEHLKMIFSTADALLGLSSMGKKTEFQGK